MSEQSYQQFDDDDDDDGKQYKRTTKMKSRAIFKSEDTSQKK